MSDWTSTAIALLEADANRSADTHLHLFPLPPEWGIDLYLKDCLLYTSDAADE